MLYSIQTMLRRLFVNRSALLAIAFAPVGASAASPAWLKAHDAQIAVLVGQMTLEEKVGQMTQPDLSAIKDFAEIERYGFGSVLTGGSTDPKTGNKREDWQRLYEECQARAMSTRLKIPLLFGVDAVHGHSNVLGAVIFPHNIGLGCTRNPALIEAIGVATAHEVRATGIQWSFAPCLAVPQDIRWGRTYEGFSEDPAIVTSFAAAAVRGLQGADLSDPSRVLGSAKHFVADGGTTFLGTDGKAGLDQGDVRVDEATLRAVHMAPYAPAIAAGVGTIMPSYSSWNGLKCSGHKYLLTDVLKGELGFEGFLISDYNAIDQLLPSTHHYSSTEHENAFGQVEAADYKECIARSINAGMDMVMLTRRYPEFVRNLVELVHEGRVPMSRIDDAVTRILRVKFAMGLKPGSKPVAVDPQLVEKFGGHAHRALARDAVRQSLVLLKNENATLPVKKNVRRIHVVGRGADDLGMQCGGWTIDWQGKLGEVTTGGTTILQAIRQRGGANVEVTFSRDGAGAAGADLAIAVVGENPYAEGKGDRIDLTLARDDAALVANLKSAGVPVALVVLSGRPLILGPTADNADAIVAAWLPGTEGAGVVDVLWGDVKPTGKLSFAWPRTMEQVGPNRAAQGAPLFPLGYGLSY